ncbi:MAG: metal ABC transporter solute-binding protein, Zn/Mn family, partial [Planctomycetota bacterium]
GADLILFVGLNLEGKMSDLFVKLARRGRHAFAVTEDLDTARLREPPELAGHYDPHIWFDVSLWQEAVRGTTRALTEVDPAGKDHYEARASAYLQRLEALHVSVKERIAQIPKERRVLVTSHDAFGYFGRAYDIDVIGLQGISTVNEAGLGDVKRIKDVIKRRGVKAVFVETSVSQKGMTAVIEGLAADGYPIKIGGKLYSDAMGAAGSPGGTYLGMIEENVKAIVGALK